MDNNQNKISNPKTEVSKGMKLNDKDYRRFTVKIDGEINDDNKFVKNFRWIE